MHSSEQPLSFDALPNGGFIRAAQLLSPGPLPFSSATLWRMVKEQRFPPPVKLSPGVTAWSVGTVRRWLHQSGGCLV